MEIFNLNKESAPLVYSIREAIPFQDAIFKFDITQKNGKSTFMHITRSAITIGAIALFTIAGLIEKAAHFTFAKIKQGIDKVLTSDQQKAIKAKAAEQANAAAEAGKGFFEKHFAPLFR